METWHLVVGLGNPGRDYAATRHNAGFQLADVLSSRWRFSWTRERAMDAELGRETVAGKRVLVCKPQTFMNLSGESVGKVAQFYKVPVGGILVAVDDADLPLGEIRLRARGSSGGHHGLDSVEKHLGSREFARLRVGIGRRDPEKRDIANYVLGAFDKSERELVDQVLERAARQVECWLEFGVERAMNQFNGVIPQQNKGQ